MKKEVILLLAGALVGFVISIITMIVTIWYQEQRERKRASKIFKIELLNISKSLIPLTAENTNLQLPNGELQPFVGISTSEILNFKMTNQLDIFLNLEDTLRSSVYDISFDLEQAEINRKFASQLLNVPNRARELNMYGTIYFDYLKSAKTKIEKLKTKLK